MVHDSPFHCITSSSHSLPHCLFIYFLMFCICDVGGIDGGSLDGWLPPVNKGFNFFSIVTPRFSSFSLLRDSCCTRKLLNACNFAVQLMIVLWQHADDLWPLSGYSIQKWPVCRGTRPRDSELVYLPHPTLATKPPPPQMCFTNSLFHCLT